MRSLVISMALALAGAAEPVLLAAQAPGVARDRAYWLALAGAKFAVPANEAPADILRASEDLLSSPDARLRDDVAYGLAVAWVYRERRVDVATLRGFASRLEARMRAGAGTAASDATLSRSFAALVLSIVAAADLREPIFDDVQYASLLNGALSNLARERDTRGHDPQVGWVHATAHTADLVKFLARSPRLARADHGRIVDAVVARVESMPQVFAWGEDERIAAALRSLVVRPDADLAALDAWLARLPAQHEALWATTPLDVPAYVRVQNAKLVLRALFASLSGTTEVPPAVAAARARVLACLQQLG